MNNSSVNPADVFGYDVVTADGNKIGSVDNVWVDDATDQLEFVAVKTGFLFGKSHIIPTADAQFGDGAITVPYSEDQIKGAPTFGGDEELDPEQEQEVYSYYGLDRTTSPSPTGLASDEGTGYSGNQEYATTAPESNGDQNLTLSEEELQVGKREVEAGRVRLRKVVHTEHQEVPVELRREEVEIERVPASGMEVPDNAFEEREIEVPVMREEPVVAKEAHVAGQVNLNKDVETETRTVGGDVRSEDVEVERDVDTAGVASGYGRTGYGADEVGDTDDPTPSY